MDWNNLFTSEGVFFLPQISGSIEDCKSNHVINEEVKRENEVRIETLYSEKGQIQSW